MRTKKSHVTILNTNRTDFKKLSRSKDLQLQYISLQFIITSSYQSGFYYLIELVWIERKCNVLRFKKADRSVSMHQMEVGLTIQLQYVSGEGMWIHFAT